MTWTHRLTFVHYPIAAHVSSSSASFKPAIQTTTPVAPHARGLASFEHFKTLGPDFSPLGARSPKGGKC